MSQEPAATVTNTGAWPGAFGIFKQSRDAVMLNIWTVLGLGFASFAVGFGLEYLATALQAPRVAGQVVGNLLSIWISVALITTYLASVRRKRISMDEALGGSLPLYINYFLLWIVLVVVLICSLLLFVVPFFFIYPRLVLAPYYLVDKKLGVMEALNVSWRESKDHLGKIWGIIGASLVFALLWFVLVGIYFSIMYAAAFAILYLYVVRPTAGPHAPAAPHAVR